MATEHDVERFLHEKAVNNEHSSVNTTRAYRAKLTAWVRFGAGADDPETATRYRDHLAATAGGADQVKATLHVLSSFYEFIGLGDERNGGNPFAGLASAFKIPKKEVSEKRRARDERVLSEIEVVRVAKHAESLCDGLTGVELYLTRRNLFIVRMLAEYGMRLGALVAVNVNDIDFMRRKLVIRDSKNQVPYPVPIVSMAGEIRSYLSARSEAFPDLDPNSGPLLLSKNGRRFSDTSARRAVNALFEAVGLYEPQRSTHQLRHYRITRYYKDGMDLDLISAITGVSVEVLKKTYLHITDEDTVRLYERWLNDSMARAVGAGEFVCPACGYREKQTHYMEAV